MPHRPIRTVDELAAALRKDGPGQGYLRIMERVDIPAEEFKPYCTWNEKRHTRNCIACTDDFELLLICYEPGQRTSIHDFATEEAWIRPVSGTVTEERYEPSADGRLRKVSAAKMDRESFSYLHNGRSIHRYINPGPERAITLNLYARPLRTWRIYDERSGEGRTAPAGA